MNSLTLIDSVLTRSFSTSSVPQRRRNANSSSVPNTAPSSEREDDGSIDSDAVGGSSDELRDRQLQRQQQSRTRKQRKQDSEPGPSSSASALARSSKLAPLTRQRNNTDASSSDEGHDDDSKHRSTHGDHGAEEDHQEKAVEVLAKEPPADLDKADKAAATLAATNPDSPIVRDRTPPSTPATTASGLASKDTQAARATGSGILSKPIPRGPSSVIRHTPKILVLDLDETLIHSTSRPRPGYELGKAGGRAGALLQGGFGFRWLLGLDGLGALLGLRGRAHGGRLRTHMVEVVLEGRSLVYYVYKRPWVDYFLRKVAAWYHVVVYTASVREYADPVIDWLDQGRGFISGRLFRDACIFSNGTYLKNLSIVDADLARVCLVDNSPASYLINPANGIPIEGWTHDPNDEALLDLLPVLDSLRFASDVRHILGLRGF